MIGKTKAQASCSARGKAGWKNYSYWILAWLVIFPICKKTCLFQVNLMRCMRAG